MTSKLARLRSIRITTDLIQHWFTTGKQTKAFDCIEGLPEDAKFCAGYLDPKDESVIVFIFWSEAFEETDISKPIPELCVRLGDHDERVAIFEDFINGLDRPE